MAAREMRTIEQGTPIDDLPDVPSKWRSVPEGDRERRSLDEWVHSVTGVAVRVRRDRRPTQMHTPETSTDDVGYVAEVKGEDVLEQITHDLGSKQSAYRRAHELMMNYPDGDFEPTFRQPLVDGPRDPDQWD